TYVPIGLFFINLSVCTLSRIFAMLRAGSYRGRSGLLRAGPDLVHISLLLLSVAGIIGLLYREEGMVDLAPGEAVRINQDYSITLKEFTARRYKDGSPRAWISRVDVRHRGEVVREDELILVNSPLKVDRVRIYQSSYKEADEGMRTVLTAVYDPSEPFVLVSLVLLAAGVIMAVLRKVLTTSW
ncbi:MAG: cytochrome c biogenesis protein ResB, partial [Spirochaetia bacterium]